MALGIFLLAGTTWLNGQGLTLNWKGSISADANNQLNWDNPTTLVDNFLVVGNTTTYANPANPLHPIISGSTDITVRTLSVAAPSVAGGTDRGQFTVSMNTGNTFYVSNPTSATAIYRGTLIVNSGILRHRRPFSVGDNESIFIVEGTGRAQIDETVHMGNSSTPTLGGKIFIRDNGVMHINATGDRLIRFAPAEGLSVLTITGNGTLEINGDHRATANITNAIAANKITGGANFFINYYFDQIANRTYFKAKPQTTVFAYFTDRLTERTIASVAGQNCPPVSLEKSNIRDIATEFIWKYGTTPGGPYNTVLSSSTTTSNLTPNFSQSGTFYLVCEAVTPGGNVVSNELRFIIGSDKIVLTPAATQFLRGAQTGTKVTATASSGTLSSGEWKWTTTQGVGHASFNPPVTGNEYTPDFAAVGTYFVAFHALVDGQPHVSAEIQVVKMAGNASALNITWNGSASDDFHNMRNWTPLAYPKNNNIIVPVTAPVWPVFRNGVDTIMGASQIHYQASPEIKAKLIIRGNTPDDVLRWRGNADGFAGELVIESGVFEKDQDLLRMGANNATLTVKGTGVAKFNQWGTNTNNTLMVGNAETPTAGGNVYISENARVFFNPPNVFRISTNPDAEFGRFFLSGNGQMIFEGDFVSGSATYITNKRIVIPANHVHRNLYDPISNKTYVLARDLSTFAIANSTTQYLAVGQTSQALTLTNTGSLSNFTWQYSAGPFGPWSDFTPGVTGTSAIVAFNQTGTYFVSAKAGDGTRVSNVTKFVVFDFKVNLVKNGNIYTLSVSPLTGMTMSGWQIKAAGDPAYETFDFAGTGTTYIVDPFHFLDGDGVYLVSYLGIVKDENAQDVNLFASPAVITISGGVVVSGVTTSTEPKKELKTGVYPNPSNGTFYINVNSDKYIVEVLDMSGAVISKQLMFGNEQTITIQRKGIFIVKVTSDEGVGISRVVVK